MSQPEEEQQSSQQEQYEETYSYPLLSGDLSTLPGSRGIPWYIRLWASVVRRAVVDWVLYKDHSNSKLRSIGKEAGQWIFSNESNSVNSFISICLYLNLEPALVRRKIRNLTEENARRLRGMEFGDEW